MSSAGLTSVDLDNQSSAPASSRHDRRRVRTRESLIHATQELVAEVGTGFSVQAVADRAGVAMTTLYNHFDSKEELLVAAGTDAIDSFESYMLARSAVLDDQLEMFCVNMRLYGRMPDTHPFHAAVITRLQPILADRSDRLHPSAVRRVTALAEAGRFNVEDVPLALMVAFASFERLIAVRLLDPSISEERVDDLALAMLRLFGLTPAKANQLIRRPLPPA